MKRVLKQELLFAVLAVSCIAWFGLVPAQAADPDSDALTITITIAGTDFGLDITTQPTAGQTSITLSVGATDFMTIPSTVTILGNVSDQEINVLGTDLDSWTLDTNETAGPQDALQLYALFSGVVRSTNPVLGDFDGAANLVTTVSSRAGIAPNGSEPGDGNYETETLGPGTASDHNVDGLAVGALRHLWFRMDAPPTTSSGSGTRRFVVTLTAVDGTTN